ncbi:HPr kinase/phosphorylase [Mesorhizobium sp. AR07]|uniref:HPr kinase/phosphorylase n=1 Tax=Mesorhizobium sp. AR07 TaxID=2865838 RepID=UPI00215FC9A7|nr:HPr kinase/phosphorylase [Mesorhizobium sp. AR07]UVK43116.1 HPr kinase/phosphorylase [Mesorhizobium sp. AR07]
MIGTDPVVQPENIHATAILIGERGILVTGASGSGKTTLALALIDHCRQRGLFSRLIGDDQLFVEAHAGRLLCRAPATIAGLVEVPGLGPRPLPFEPAGIVDLHVRLMPSGETARFQEDAGSSIAGCQVPRIDVAERNIVAALPVVMARLSIAPFL